MSPIEIIFVVLGISILIASCFVGSKEEKTETGMLLQDEALELQKQELKKYAETLLEEKSEEVIVKTDDYLSKISNEKIMSVNDFSTQIMEKIDANHKEVVFLYDMLNQKEDEMKQTVQQLDTEKQEMQKAVGDIIKLTRQMKSTIQKGESTKKAATERQKRPENSSPTTKAKASASSKTEEAVSNETVIKTDTQAEYVENLQADKQREEVLRLSREGKNVLEISKAMGMGQGEVKLIIGLYGA